MLPFNSFSIFDLLALLVTLPLAVTFYLRFCLMGRRMTELLLANMLLCTSAVNVIIFLTDNVVPTRLPSNQIDGASLTLFFYRMEYCFGALVLAMLIHFLVRYQRWTGFLSKNIALVYAVVLCALPFFWTRMVLVARPKVMAERSSWLCTVPWQPTIGPLGWVFPTIWVVSFFISVYVLWGGGAKKESLDGELGKLGAWQVKVAVTLWYASGFFDMVIGAFDLASIAMIPPMSAISGSLLAMALFVERLASEKERELVTRRFRSYVDPALVDYVISHPNELRLQGRVDELTVVFTDLAGFTQLSEELGALVVQLVSDFRAQMVPVIRHHHGYVNKFLGDGMMFFFGAPQPDADHAMRALDASMEMLRTLQDFNHKVFRRVSMRIGISTGTMIVGDAGSEEASDYTVFGDAVNLGARLETANKETGTTILLSERTRELIGDRYLFRPVGKLHIRGQAAPVMAYEPLCPSGSATDRDRKSAAQAQTIFNRYLAADFTGCIAAVTEAEQFAGHSKLLDLYRSNCQRLIANPPTNGFAGELLGCHVE